MIRRRLPLDLMSARERAVVEYDARFRGDESYADTVASVASTSSWRIVDTHGSRHGLIHAAYIANADLIEAAGMYWRFAGLACGLGGEKELEWGTRTARLWAYIYQVKWQGWLAFCEELGLDSDLWLNSMAGSVMRYSMEGIIDEVICPTEAEAAELLRIETEDDADDTDDEADEVDGEKPPKVITAETVKRRLLHWVEQFEAAWA